MDIANFKRWQWCIVGLLLGAGLGFFWSSPDLMESDAMKLSQAEFEANLLAKDPKTNEPILTNITVQPPVTDYQGKTVNIVTFNALRRGATSGNTYRVPAQFLAVEPYKPHFRNVVSDLPKNGAPLTITDFINAAAKRNDQIKLKYGWWNERPAAIGLWTVGGLVLIGGVWPTVVSLLVSGGFAPKPKPAKQKSEEEAYLDQFGKGGVETDTMPARTVQVSSEAQRAELDDMNAKLEESLKAAGVQTNVDSQPATQEEIESELLASAPTIRKLEGGKLEKSKIKVEEAEEVEVKGEYYPVIMKKAK